MDRQGTLSNGPLSYMDLPKHFQPQNREHWGDLKAYLGGRPTQSAPQHLKQYQSALRRIAQNGAEEDRKAADALLELVTVSSFSRTVAVIVQSSLLSLFFSIAQGYD